MPTFTQKTWVDVPDEANPPVGAVATSAAEFNRLEQGIADSVDHANAVYAVHGGLTWYVAASGSPPTAPPNGLPWWQTDVKAAVVNTGTSGSPVWESAAVDPSKLSAVDLVTDYVVSGLLPSVPTNSLTLSVPSGVAYASGRRVSTSTTSHTVPGRKATLVDLSYLGVFSNVDYGILLDDTEDAWLEKTDADFTQSVVAGPTGQGNAVRFVIAAGASAGDTVSEAIPTADLTPYGKIAVWVRSSVTHTAGQLQLLLDNTAQVASPVHTLNIPNLTANTWTLCEIAYDNTQVGTGSIISIGLKYTVDIGAATVDICKPYALKASEPAVSANSVRLFEARADADIAQVELVDITTAVNSTAYTVRINGVDVVYTSDASATEGEIALGLVAALNASVDPAVTPITASTAAIAGDASATLTITADVPGVAFTILVGANLSVANQTPNSASSVIEVVDRRDLDPTLRGAGTHNFWSASHPDIDTTDVPANGEVVTYDSATSKWKSSPVSVAGAYRTLVTLGSDVANSTTSLADVTGLSFSVVANTVYRIEALIAFDSAASATGSKWTINGPSIAGGFVAVVAEWTAGAATWATNTINAMDSAPSFSATSFSTTGNLARIAGVLKPTASGTVAIRFASEVAASAITAKAGSTLEWW